MVVMRSCCCCNMRSGSILIAVLYMLFTGLVLLGLGLMLAYYNDNLKPIVYNVMYGINASSDQLNSIANGIDTSITTTRNVLVASIILKSLYFFLCLLLFVGGVKERSGFLVPWLIADFVRQLLFFAAFVFMAWFTGVLVAKKIADYGVLIILCILLLFIIALTFYFWLAVIGALQEFREREMQVAPEEIKHPYPAEDSLVIQD